MESEWNLNGIWLSRVVTAARGLEAAAVNQNRVICRLDRPSVKTVIRKRVGYILSSLMLFSGARDTEERGI